MSAGVRLVTVLVSAFGLILALSVPLLVQAQPPIFHPLEGRVNQCLDCHRAGILGAPKVAGDHSAYTNQMCLSCHRRPGGNLVPLYAAFIPFAIALGFGLSRVVNRVGMRHVVQELTRRRQS
jgi:hypothetical protein